jgi:hypothetical protein
LANLSLFNDFLHLNLYEVFIFENELRFKFITKIAPHYLWVKPQIRTIKFNLKSAEIFPSLIRSVEYYLNEATELSTVIRMKAFLIDLKKAIRFTVSALLDPVIIRFNSGSSTAATSPPAAETFHSVQKIAVKDACQLVHDVLFAFVTSSHYKEIIENYPDTEITKGKRLRNVLM